VIKEYCHDREAWWKARTQARIEAPGKPSNAWLAFDLAGVALVVIGIGGELYIEAKVAENETNLRDANAKLVSFLEGDVKDAAEKLRLANIRFDAIENKAGLLDKSLGMTETRVSGIIRKANDLDTQLQTTAARLNTEDLTILAKQSGHRFLPKLFGTLKGLKPAKATVQFVCNSEMETMSFTTELIEGLKTNGWSVERAPHCALMKPDEISLINGITIFNNSIDFEAFLGFPSPVLGIDDRPEADFEVLLDTAFRNVKEKRRLANLMVSIGARAKKDPKLDDDTLRIVVGSGTTHANSQ
jgi:hypothetical protein